MTIFDFIADMYSGAPPDRAGRWLQENEATYPELAAAIQNNLTAAPDKVLEALSQHWPLVRLYAKHPPALHYIAKLQGWLLEHQRNIA